MVFDVELLDEAQCVELEMALVDHIYQFNGKATGYFDGSLLGGSIRTDSGELMGGFSGHTWGRCLRRHTSFGLAKSTEAQVLGEHS